MFDAKKMFSEFGNQVIVTNELKKTIITFGGVDHEIDNGDSEKLNEVYGLAKVELGGLLLG